MARISYSTVFVTEVSRGGTPAGRAGDIAETSRSDRVTMVVEYDEQRHNRDARYNKVFDT